MEAFELLREDHRRAEELLSRLRSGNGMARPREFQELKRVLEIHARIEEEIFYPALIHMENTSAMVREALDEHAGVKRLLSRMSEVDAHDPAWSSWLEELERNVAQHVREEEQILFPQAEEVLSTRLREDLGERLQARRSELSATWIPGAGERVEDAAGMARDRAALLRARAREKGRELFHSQTAQIAEQISGIAATLHHSAEAFEGQGQGLLARYTDQAAAGLEHVSRTLREGEPEALVHQVQDLARRSPAVFIGAAAAAGFLLVRFLKSESPAESLVPGAEAQSWQGAAGPGSREIH